MDDDFLFWDEEEDYKPLKAPFAWCGGKSRIAAKIVENLPHSDTYVEVFGGSGAVLLHKPPCKLDVYNDRFTGVAAFYRCLADDEKYPKLLEKLNLMIHSRENFYIAKQTWEQAADDVTRASLWYQTIEHGFASIPRAWGRVMKPPTTLSARFRKKLKMFPQIHERISKVQVENCNYKVMFQDYDSPETVFYCDPPYLDTDVNIYKHKWSMDDQLELLEIIFKTKGFVALSGYDSTIVDLFPWDDKLSWESYVSAKNSSTRESATEILWIKEAFSDE